MLSVNQQTISLGKLTNGKPYNFHYVVTNSSNEQLVIKQITVGCGSCTQASIDKYTLAPGEVTYLRVVFTPNSSGLQMKTVSIEYGTEQELAKNKVQAIHVKFTAEVY